MERIDRLTKDGVLQFLDNKQTQLIVLDTVDSTNTYLKNIANTAQHGSVVIAQSQTKGRGRFERRFHSPENSGIYMSIFLRPELPAESSILITTAAAVAVSEACEALSGKKCKIKWVNDVLINSKKICGILTEGAINPNSAKLDYAILGVGINVYEPESGFCEEIKDIAACVFKKQEKDLSNRLAADIINRFMIYFNELDRKTFLQSYRERCDMIGKAVTVIRGESMKSAVALKVDDDCRLLVEYEDKAREYLSSGEVSIRRS